MHQASLTPIPPVRRHTPLPLSDCCTTLPPPLDLMGGGEAVRKVEEEKEIVEDEVMMEEEEQPAATTTNALIEGCSPVVVVSPLKTPARPTGRTRLARSARTAPPSSFSSAQQQQQPKGLRSRSARVTTGKRRGGRRGGHRLAPANTPTPVMPAGRRERNQMICQMTSKDEVRMPTPIRKQLQLPLHLRIRQKLTQAIPPEEQQEEEAEEEGAAMMDGGGVKCSEVLAGGKAKKRGGGGARKRADGKDAEVSVVEESDGAEENNSAAGNAKKKSWGVSREGNEQQQGQSSEGGVDCEKRAVIGGKVVKAGYRVLWLDERLLRFIKRDRENANENDVYRFIVQYGVNYRLVVKNKRYQCDPLLRDLVRARVNSLPTTKVAMLGVLKRLGLIRYYTYS
eukprot:GHVS01082721.1.p1 GENE.GHVS01082721.1~~GHVS01082721.1.p1  ORF type:complete len:396 (+),score=108.43 GHVS01082721.1:520-1707(+)